MPRSRRGIQTAGASLVHMPTTAPLKVLVYASQAREGLANADLDTILDDAAALNAAAGITGVLLFDGQRFLQYLEGPADSVSVAFFRVQRSRRHSQIEVLMEGESLAGRVFGAWSMACRHASPSLMQRLLRAKWEHLALPHLHAEGDADSGLTLLRGFWRGDSPTA